jgi:hypothetical protein
MKMSEKRVTLGNQEFRSKQKKQQNQHENVQATKLKKRQARYQIDDEMMMTKQMGEKKTGWVLA